MVACLNHQYRDKIPDVDGDFLFYRYVNDVWSVAYLDRRVPQVLMFDGISIRPYNMEDDEKRKERIYYLIAAVEAYFTSVGDCIDILFYNTRKFSDIDSICSGTLCIV
ncbi:hypothetical protein C8A01DRAFT_38478 [Parachaetomium inaequale]|uniref:Uncharacterized protein n=1 Tax=Parachaetomium inaequale TaxID=2588326 RepID=A0AAN6SP86_9PEZI|nr:hypothetical protein C8A01DRAFT_38478 [Parachaetomium inaequale]